MTDEPLQCCAHVSGPQLSIHLALNQLSALSDIAETVAYVIKTFPGPPEDSAMRP